MSQTRSYTDLTKLICSADSSAKHVSSRTSKPECIPKMVATASPNDLEETHGTTKTFRTSIVIGSSASAFRPFNSSGFPAKKFVSGHHSPDSALHNSDCSSDSRSDGGSSEDGAGFFPVKRSTSCKRLSLYDSTDDNHSDYDDDYDSDNVCYKDYDLNGRMWRGRENDAPPTLSVSVRQLVRVS